MKRYPNGINFEIQKEIRQEAANSGISEEDLQARTELELVRAIMWNNHEKLKVNDSLYI